MSLYNFFKAVSKARDEGPSHSPPESAKSPPPAKKANISSNEKSPFETLSKSGPVRDNKAQYPKTAFGKTLRSFKPDWFESRDWLEYIADQDTCRCHPCRIYSKTPGEFHLDFSYKTSKGVLLNSSMLVTYLIYNV